MRLITILLLFPLLMQGQVLFYDDCEASNKPLYGGTNANIAQFWNFKYAEANASITRSNTYARRGSWSYRHVLNDPPSNLNTWEYLKAELCYNFAPAGVPAGTLGANNRLPVGLRWFAQSTLIPSSNNDFNTITNIGLTMKAWPDDYTTPSYLTMEQGRYYLFVTPVNAQLQAQPQRKYDCGPVVKDVWVDWVLHRNFTSRDSGYVELFKNGELVASYYGGNFKDDAAHAKEAYMVTGLYKWAFRNGWSPVPDVSQVVMYTDEFRTGLASATLSDFIVPGVTPPNQPPSISLASPVSTTNTSVQVVATSTDADGTISDRIWTFLSGPNTPSLTGTTADTLIAGSLIDGTYQFRLIATDDDGAKDTAFLTIVKSSPPPALGLIFSDGAEATVAPLYGGNNSDITQYFSNRVGATYNTLVKTNQRARLGNNSYRIAVRDTSLTGFQYVDNELVWYYFPAETAVDYRWGAFSLYTDSAMAGDATPTKVGLNYILYPTVDPIPNYLSHENDSAIFYIRKYNTGGTDLGYTRVPIAPIAFNTWTDWALNRDFTLSSSGFVRLYRNKTMVFEYIGPNYNPSGIRPEPYVQTGIFKPAYDSGGNNKDSVYFNYDEIKFGGPGANINIMSPNQNPVVSTSPLITDKDTGRVIASVVDSDGGIATKVWIQVSGPSTADTVGTRGDTLRFQNLVNGIYRFQMIATDSLGGVGTSLVTVTKEASYNQPPIVSAPAEKTYYNDASILIVIDAADPEATALSYQWIQESGPQANIVTANQKDLLLTNPREGTYRFIVQVTDEDGQMTSEPVSFIFQRFGGRVIRLPAGPVRVVPSNN